MKDKIKAYREKLEKGICDYMLLPFSERSVPAINNMIECWKHIAEMESEIEKKTELTKTKAIEWVDGMKNDDGTHGAHWTVEQTTAVAESLDIPLDTISEYCWWATMNMMYSDYVNVAIDYKVDVPDFYANLAEAFLFDKDAGSPKQKLGAYYSCIAKHN